MEDEEDAGAWALEQAITAPGFLPGFDDLKEDGGGEEWEDVSLSEDELEEGGQLEGAQRQPEEEHRQLAPQLLSVEAHDDFQELTPGEQLPQVMVLGGPESGLLQRGGMRPGSALRIILQAHMHMCSAACSAALGLGLQGSHLAALYEALARNRALSSHLRNNILPHLDSALDHNWEAQTKLKENQHLRRRAALRQKQNRSSARGQRDRVVKAETLLQCYAQLCRFWCAYLDSMSLDIN